jgi:MEMO1 family protein
MPFWTQNPQETTRRAQYAGSWYDSNPSKLRQELDNYLASTSLDPDQLSGKRVQSDSLPLEGEVLAVIVPHAGYVFSGQTAAWAYNAARKNNPRRVFLLGPSHYAGFPGAGLPQATSFATPLGNLELDTDLIAELKSYPHFSVQADVHKVEHSLELQLPFIKHCFGEVKIVPIVIGHINDEEEAREIGGILKGVVGRGDLVVVSSDFTHYGPRFDYAPFAGKDDVPDRVGQLDGQAFQLISKLDLEGFSEFLAKSNDTICGMYPIEVLLSMLPRQAHGTLLKYMTSRDSLAEDGENSVSYLAIAFSGADWRQSEAAGGSVVSLSEDERRCLLKLARQTIETFVKTKRLVSAEELGIKITETMKECYGVFVTITRKAEEGTKPEHKELRGCIGSIYASKPLYKAVQENAISSACRDHRFMPVSADELTELELELSILSPPRRVDSWQDIVVGRDGVILSKGRHQAVFLPQVALEWNWSRNEMLSQLALKAGLRADDWQEGANFDVFQAEKFHEQDS